MRLLYILLLLSLCINSVAQNNETLIPVKIGDQWGYVNFKGEFVINPQYYKAGAFVDGLALVLEEDLTAHYINAKNESVITISSEHWPFNFCRSFSSGLAKVEDRGIEKRRCFFVDKEGKKYGIFEDSGDYIIGGFVPVKYNGKWGLFGINGSIDPVYDYIGGFYDGYAEVCRDGKIGFIDTLGREVIKPQYDTINCRVGRFSEGLCAIEIDGKFGFIDRNNVMVIKPQFQCKYIDLQIFSGGLDVVEFGEDKYGVIDKTGKIVIFPRFYEIYPFKTGEKYTKVFITSEYLREEEKDAYLKSSEDRLEWGIFQMPESGKFMRLDRNGVLYPFYADMHEGLGEYKENGKYGFVNEYGKVVIQAKFDKVYWFTNGYCMVVLNGKYGLIDKQGNFKISPTFDDMYFMDEKYYNIKINGKEGLIDATGKYILQPFFDRIGFWKRDDDFSLPNQ